MRRPKGQRRKGRANQAPTTFTPAKEAEPSFASCRNLDLQLELGVWIGPGNALGEPIPIAEAAQRVAGFCLVNDWSAHDIQRWEYQLLGPFLAKNFATRFRPGFSHRRRWRPLPFPSAAGQKGDPAPLPLGGLRACGGLVAASSKIKHLCAKD